MEKEVRVTSERRGRPITVPIRQPKKKRKKGRQKEEKKEKKKLALRVSVGGCSLFGLSRVWGIVKMPWPKNMTWLVSKK